MGIRLVVAALIAAATLSACGSATDGSPAGTPPRSSAAPPTTTSTKAAPTPTPATSSSTHPTTSSAPSATTEPVPTTPLSTKTVTASDGSVYAVAIWAQQNSADCAAHAYGQVADFLAAHDCRGIRQLLGTTAIDGRAVGFAQNSIGFGGGMNAAYQAAGKFTTLVTADGTGNLNDLLREGHRLPAGPDRVPSPDAFRVLGQDAGVVVTDAWYLTGPTPANDPALLAMAEALFLQI